MKQTYKEFGLSMPKLANNLVTFSQTLSSKYLGCILLRDSNLIWINLEISPSPP